MPDNSTLAWLAALNGMTQGLNQGLQRRREMEMENRRLDIQDRTAKEMEAYRQASLGQKTSATETSNEIKRLEAKIAQSETDRKARADAASAENMTQDNLAKIEDQILKIQEKKTEFTSKPGNDLGYFTPEKLKKPQNQKDYDRIVQSIKDYDDKLLELQTKKERLSGASKVFKEPQQDGYPVSTTGKAGAAPKPSPKPVVIPPHIQNAYNAIDTAKTPEEAMAAFQKAIDSGQVKENSKEEAILAKHLLSKGF